MGLIATLQPDAPLTTEAFLSHLLPIHSGVGVLAWQQPGSKAMRQESFTDVKAMAARAFELDSHGATIYHAAATYRHAHDAKRPNGDTWGRKIDNVAALGAFFLDVDVGVNKPYATTEQARFDLERFYLAVGTYPHIIVESSGGEYDSGSTGLHVYWLLDRDLSVAEWTPIARRLKEACYSLGLHADPARTADCASLLRPVGTTNRKPEYGDAGRSVVGRRVRFGQVCPELFDSKLQRAIAISDEPKQVSALGSKPPFLSQDRTLVTLAVSAADNWFDRLDEATKTVTLKSLLDALPDDAVEARESWLGVGAALAGTTDVPLEERFVLWAEWSQRTPAGAAKWQADTEDEHRARWEGLTRSGIGALIRRAEEAGWSQEALRVAGNEKFELVAAARSASGARMSISEAQAYMRSNAVHVATNGGMFLLNGVEMSKDSMDMTLAPQMPPGERAPITASSLFKNGCGVAVDHVGYRPGAERFYKDMDGVRFVNTWKKHAIETMAPTDEDRRTFAEFFIHLGNRDRETRAGLQRVCTKLAYLIENPGKRIRHATLLIGPHEGCGKTTLTLEIPRALFGAANVRNVETRELSSDFNGYAQGAQILVFPELWLGNRKDALEQANSLKPLITDDHIPMVKKGRDGVMLDNCTTIFANSNHADAAVFGEMDRRYDVIATSAQVMPRELAERIYALIKARPGALRQLVLAYGKGADRFDPNAPPPMTVAKARMIEAGRDVWVERLKDDYAAAVGPFARDVVTVTDLRRWLERDFERLPGDNRIREELLRLEEGAVSMRAQRRHGDNRQQVRVIVLRNIKSWTEAGPSALYDHYAGNPNDSGHAQSHD